MPDLALSFIASEYNSRSNDVAPGQFGAVSAAGLVSGLVGAARRLVAGSEGFSTRRVSDLVGSLLLPSVASAFFLPVY